MKSYHVVRVNPEDRKFLYAIGKGSSLFGKRATGRNILHGLLEFWLNANPEEHLRILYNGGYRMDVPGYALRWDMQAPDGEKPEYIKLADFQPKPRLLEIKRFYDTASGRIVERPVYSEEDTFFDQGYEGGREYPDEDSEEEESDDTDDIPDTHVYVNRDTGRLRYSTGPVEDNEEEMMVVYDTHDYSSREEHLDYELKPYEKVVTLFEDPEDGELRIRGVDDEEDEPQSQPEFTSVSGSSILRSGK